MAVLGGMESHKLPCHVRVAMPGHAETGCRVGKAECQVLQRHQRMGFCLGGCRLEMCKGQPRKCWSFKIMQEMWVEKGDLPEVLEAGFGLPFPVC